MSGKIKLDAPLVDFDGEIITETAPIKGKWVKADDGTMQQAIETEEDGSPKLVPVTLRKVLRNALLYKAPGEDLPLKEQMKRAELVKRINKAEEIALKSEDVTLCKELVAKVFTITVLSAVVDLIDPAAATE